MPEKDIDLSRFRSAKEAPAPHDLGELTAEEVERLQETGIDLREKGRSGTFVQTNCSVVHCAARPKGLELLPVTEALKRYSWLEDYWWKAVSPEADEFVKATDVALDNGYFIRVLPGEKVVYPVQTCLYIREENIAQKVHNIIIAEEGAELHVITGCTTAPHLVSGLHIGVSEFYVKAGAKLVFTMIHNWSENIHVRPRTGIFVEEGGSFLSNYISLRPVKSIQTYPTARLRGPGALARFNSVIVSPAGSFHDVGSRVYLSGEGSRAEIVSRTISYGGTIVARGHLIGQAPEIKAHLECQGLILAENGVIRAIPELEAHLPNVDMSHEAAVGKIAQEEIEYLMARGLDEDEATSTIVRGFLNVKIEGLPMDLQAEIDRAIEECQREGM